MQMGAIERFAAELKIPYLLHFTRASNLLSIMQHGLYPIARADEIGIEPQINDQHRLDGRLNGTSVSIAFPNCQMFYKYRMADESVDWAVLVLKPSVLWQKECAFCRYNAADARISRRPLEALATEAALRGMFDEIDGWETRQDQKLKPFDPTDVQAEVMVFGIIEPEYFHGIVFGSKESRDAYAHLLSEVQKNWVHRKNKGVFATRKYFRKYQQG